MQIQLTASHESIRTGEECTFTLTALPGSTVLLIGFERTSKDLETEILRFESFLNEVNKYNQHKSDLFMLKNEEHSSNRCSNQKIDHIGNEKTGNFGHIKDSWFFETIKVEEEIVEITKSAPEKVGTFTIAAAIFHPEHSAVNTEIQSIKVTTDISMQVIMPASTRYREPTRIDVLVFNFMSKAEKVQVTLSKNDNYEDFEFLDCKRHSNDGFLKTHELEVAENSVGSVAFFLRPMKSKNLEINLKIEPENAESIETERILLVDEEGLTKYGVTSQLIDLRDSRSFASHLQLPIYDEAMPKSVKVEASIETDLIKTALLNARQLM